MSPAFALLGAGEFEDWHASIDQELLAAAEGDGRVLVAPVASAPEGDDVFASWAAKGLDHYGRIDVPVQVLPLKTRADAERPEVVEMLDDASLVFFSGGNPWYVAQTLADTPLYERLRARIDEGMAYAGCSAGVACLTERTYDSGTDDFDEVFKPGLGYARGVLFAPHWDVLDSWIPGAREAIVASMVEGETLVGMDERTAILGDGTNWRVRGAGRIHVLREQGWEIHADGDTLDLPIRRDAIDTETSR
jgi:cyanophycinase